MQARMNKNHHATMVNKPGRVVTIITLIICIACCNSCTPIPELIFWNNTGGKLEINSDGKLHSIPNGSSEIVRFPGNTMKLSIRNVSGTVWHYAARYPSQAFILHHKRTFVQIQPDGSIYVLNPPAGGIVTNFPAQPPGFPLRPQD